MNNLEKLKNALINQKPLENKILDAIFSLKNDAYKVLEVSFCYLSNNINIKYECYSDTELTIVCSSFRNYSSFDRKNNKTLIFEDFFSQQDFKELYSDFQLSIYAISNLYSFVLNDIKNFSTSENYKLKELTLSQKKYSNTISNNKDDYESDCFLFRPFFYIHLNTLNIDKIKEIELFLNGDKKFIQFQFFKISSLSKTKLLLGVSRPITLKKTHTLNLMRRFQSEKAIKMGLKEIKSKYSDFFQIDQSSVSLLEEEFDTLLELNSF